MSVIINARSPYYIKLSYASLYKAEVDIFIYSGTLTTDKPATPTYILEQYTTTGNDYVIIELSEIIRDYLYTEYYTEAVDAVWVEVDYDLKNVSDVSLSTGSLDYLAFDGYGDFLEGANPRTSTNPTNASYTPMVLQDNINVYFIKGKDIKIPFFSEPNPTITTNVSLGVWNEVDYFWEQTDYTWDYLSVPQSVTDNDNSLNKIQYLVIDSSQLETGTEITFTSTTGNSQITTINLIEYCEPKYEPYRIIFYNKYGTLQDIWASKRSNVSINSKDESYKSNVMDFSQSTPSYSIYKHSKKRFNVELNKSITLNTDFLKEEYNEVIEQMMASEQIWIENNTDTIPVILKSKSLQFKTSVNDKLIQYTFEFDYAFDTIQNIR